MGKTIEVYPCAGKTPRTAPVWQYDYGQIIHINGITLPASYKAEFSNTTRGDAIATVQTTDEITIPAQYLESGAAVYIWLVVVDESSRTTEYALVVPVANRAKPTDEEPAPAEQSEIDQTLAALNSGVSLVEQIAEAIPDTINDALEAAKESGEFDGKDGYTPVKGVDYFDGKDGIDGKDGKDGADGYTPQKGIDYFDGEDGKDGKDGKDGADGQTGPAGKDGAPGTPGADGTTFTPSVSDEGVISWTNDGGKTNPHPMNIKGPQGGDGTSPTVSVTDITGGHRVTVTDANGTRSFDVMDGDDYTLTAADKAKIAQQAAEEVDVPVQDVQVNGTSVLNAQGVANIPLASANTPGVVQTGTAPVSGTTPSITALPGIQYVCGEVATLDITLPTDGCVDVVFQSGSTATVLTVTPPTGVTLKWSNGFDPSSLEANTTYEINIKDGLGVAASWT